MTSAIELLQLRPNDFKAAEVNDRSAIPNVSWSRRLLVITISAYQAWSVYPFNWEHSFKREQGKISDTVQGQVRKMRI